MANVLNGTQAVVIAQTGLAEFSKALINMNVFTTDFSANAERAGIVKTRIVPASQDAVLLSDYNYDRTHSNVCADSTTDEVIITLSDYAVGFHMDDADVQRMSPGVVTDTRDKLLAKKANALAAKVQMLAFGLIKDSAYGDPVFSNVAAQFNTNVISDIRKEANEAGWKGTQSIVLNSDFTNVIRKDESVKYRYASGKDTNESGIIGKLSGFDIQESTILPANSEYLAGFACTPDCLAIAVRPTFTQASDMLLAYEVATDPATGLTIVYRAFYLPQVGKTYHTYEVSAGVQVGVKSALKRIVTQ